MSPALHADGRFWFSLDGRSFLGRGRVELLQHIDSTGSIAQAARAMKMSYKAAWDAVDAMNKAAMNTTWRSPLVESHPGGSRLTTEARQLIAGFAAAQRAHADFLATLADPIRLDLPDRAKDDPAT